MTNVMRKRYDFSANPAMVLDFPVDLAVGIEIGDLVWHDVDDVKPANHTGLWTGTEAGTLGRFAEKFVGIAMSAKVAADPLVTSIRVATRGVFAHPLNASTVLEMGDLIGAKKDPLGNYLYNQVVTKVTNPEFAIGKVVKRGTLGGAATAVLNASYEIASRSAAGGGNRAFLTS